MGGAELGVKDGGGVGGGKGWSIGAPYGRMFMGGWREAPVGIDEEIDGIINDDDEEGGVKNEEGLTRLVTRLPLLLFKSDVLCSEIGADGAERERAGTCGVGTGEETIGP